MNGCRRFPIVRAACCTHPPGLCYERTVQLFPSASQVRGPMLPKAVGAVAAGGAVGATARWAIGTTIDTSPGAWPWPTLVVNLVGCLLIGLAARRLRRGSIAWDVAVTGVLGGFTTMSALAVELNDMVDAERPGLAVLYAVVSLAGGVGAVSLARPTMSRRDVEAALGIEDR